jgi:energy-coupling factor transport system permease protein
MVPLVSNALSRANVLGLTIDIRGYRTRERTIMHEPGLTGGDYVTVSLMVVVSIGFVAALLMRMI